jgi:hypothetical protein
LLQLAFKLLAVALGLFQFVVRQFAIGFAQFAFDFGPFSFDTVAILVTSPFGCFKARASSSRGEMMFTSEKVTVTFPSVALISSCYKRLTLAGQKGSDLSGERLRHQA